MLYDAMIAHALADAPDECCGIVASVDGVAVRVFAGNTSDPKTVTGQIRTLVLVDNVNGGQPPQWLLLSDLN